MTPVQELFSEFNTLIIDRKLATKKNIPSTIKLEDITADNFADLLKTQYNSLTKTPQQNTDQERDEEEEMDRGREINKVTCIYYSILLKFDAMNTEDELLKESLNKDSEILIYRTRWYQVQLKTYAEYQKHAQDVAELKRTLNQFDKLINTLDQTDDKIELLYTASKKLISELKESCEITADLDMRCEIAKTAVSAIQELKMHLDKDPSFNKEKLLTNIKTIIEFSKPKPHQKTDPRFVLLLLGISAALFIVAGVVYPPAYGAAAVMLACTLLEASNLKGTTSNLQKAAKEYTSKIERLNNPTSPGTFFDNKNVDNNENKSNEKSNNKDNDDFSDFDDDDAIDLDMKSKF